MEAIEALLAAGAEIGAEDDYYRCYSDWGDGTGWTPLHWAASEGHAQAVQALLAAGAFVDRIATCYDSDYRGYSSHIGDDWEGQTPLHLASEKGHLQTVLVLLEAGADTDVRNDEGRSALHLAAEAGHKGVVEALLAAGAKRHSDDSEEESSGESGGKGEGEEPGPPGPNSNGGSSSGGHRGPQPCAALRWQAPRHAPTGLGFGASLRRQPCHRWAL